VNYLRSEDLVKDRLVEHLLSSLRDRPIFSAE